MVTYIPPEMMEKILSRLPVKSLVRFKSACKPWNALISSHPFIRTHLLHSSQSHALFIRQLLYSSEKQLFDKNLLRFQDGQFHVHPPPENPKQNLIFHCSCNGILLLENISQDSSTLGLGDLILWNPSMRKITQFFLPLQVRKITRQVFPGGARRVVDYGLCYDPATVDLKVVVFFFSGYFNYAVYSCKNKSWKSWWKHEVIASNIIWLIYPSDMVCVDGAAYWIIHRSRNGACGDLLCFESEGDKMKTVQRPSDLKESDWFYLISLRGRLCVWWSSNSVVRIWMREEGEVWRDFMRIHEDTLPSYNLWQPLYVDVGENNEIIITFCLAYTDRTRRINTNRTTRIMVYHLRQKTYQEFDWPLNENADADAGAVITTQLSYVDSLLFFDQHPAGESAAYLLMQMQAP